MRTDRIDTADLRDGDIEHRLDMAAGRRLDVPEQPTLAARATDLLCWVIAPVLVAGVGAWLHVFWGVL